MKTIVFLILLLSLQLSFGQTSTIDSLEQVFNQKKSNQAKVETLIDIANEYIFLGMDSLALKKINTAENLIGKSVSIENQSKIYNVKGSIFRNMRLFDKSNQLFEKSTRTAKSSKSISIRFKILNLSQIALNKGYAGNINQADSIHKLIKSEIQKLSKPDKAVQKVIINWYGNYAIFLFGKEKKDEAIKYFQKCLEGHISLKSPPKSILNAYQNLGFALDRSDKPDRALKVYFKAVNYCDKHDLPKNNLYSKIGALFLIQTDYAKCIKYSKLAIGDNDNINAIAYNNIAVSYMNQKEFSKAKTYLRKSIFVGEKTDLPRQKVLKYNNIGLIYLEANEHLDSAEYFLKISVKNALKTNLPESISSSKMCLGRCYLMMDKFDEAIPLLRSAFNIADSLEMTDIKGKSAFFLYESNKSLNKFREALKWHEIFNEYQKEYEQKRKKIAVEEIEAKFQNEKKQNKILKLSNANNLEKAKTANLRLWNYGIVGGTCFLLLSIIFLWNRRRLKHKQKTLEVSIQASEQEKVRIGKELHDGIANELITFFYKIEDTQPEIAHQVLTSYQKVRKVSHQLDNTAPHGTPISERLIDLIPDNDIETIINISPQYLELDEPIGTHIYRIAQELLINTKKYAKANTIDLQITVHNQTLFFSFKDDGIGTGNFTPGNGHKNISDRVQLMSGTINIKTDNEHGFNVKIEIPLK